MQVLLIALLLTTSVLAAPKHPGARIIGGRNAYAGEYPFAAAITLQTNVGQYFCGGALLNTQHILTSGSCVDGGVLFSIRLGIENLNSNAGDRLATDSYTLHPQYNPVTVQNDLGIIQLRLPIIFNDYIQPIRLPTRDVQPYAIVDTIGWGQINDEDAGLVNALQAVTLTALSNDECRLTFGSAITDNMVCVDGNYNQGTCYGDTGGPLVQYVNGHQATVVGISSFVSGNGCESTDPSGFTRTYPYLDWINANSAV